MGIVGDEGMGEQRRRVDGEELIADVPSSDHILCMSLKLLTDSQIRDRDLDTLKRFIRYKIGGYVVAINNVPAGHPLYRGVRCPERPCTIERISYPPVDRVTTFGRVNRPGNPMFYCSVAAPSVFYELRAKRDDLIALSAWELIEPLWMHHLGYHQDALRRMGVQDVTLRRRLTHPIPNEPKENAKLRRQLSLAFTEDVPLGAEHRYKQSIAINELLFDGASSLPIYPHGPQSDRAAGTVYPAMQMKGAADNLAIWPSFVDSSLRLKSIRYVRIKVADEAKLSYTLLTLAISHEFHGNEIVWEDGLPAESARRSHITFENGEWILRDGQNRIYDRH